MIINFSLTSCKVKKNITDTYKVSLIEDYKKVYFHNCLKYGFNNSKRINNILNEDFSLNSDFVHGIRNYEILDSLSKVIVKEIKTDSVEFYNVWQVRGEKGF